MTVPGAHWWARDVAAGETKGPAARLAGIFRPFNEGVPEEDHIKSSKMRLQGEDRPVQGYRRAPFERVWRQYGMTTLQAETGPEMVGTLGTLGTDVMAATSDVPTVPTVPTAEGSASDFPLPFDDREEG